VPPLLPPHVQANGPKPETADAAPVVQRLVVGATRKIAPFELPQVPLTGTGAVPNDTGVVMAAFKLPAASLNEPAGIVSAYTTPGFRRGRQQLIRVTLKTEPVPVTTVLNVPIFTTILRFFVIVTFSENERAIAAVDPEVPLVTNARTVGGVTSAGGVTT
jgi:hypothetical protein